MAEFPIDVVEFVEARFSPRDFDAVFRVLKSDLLRRPHLMRASLFLADGDLSLLRHYVKRCKLEPTDVLARAEFVIGATSRPLCAADFSELFLPGRASGRTGANPAQPKRAAKGGSSDDHHDHLKGMDFDLGSITYAVAERQPHAQCVYCYRKEGTNSRLVRLPYVFVMDRLAERIELKATDASEL